MPNDNPRGGDRPSLDLRTTLTRQRILEGARQVFLLNGFRGASIDQIAAEAAVSKGSLHHHFGRKEDLFKSLIAEEAARIAQALPSLDPCEPDPCSALRQMGGAAIETLNHPTTAATLRLIIGALGIFPRLGEEFLRASLGPTMEQIATYLERQAASGTIGIDNGRVAAEEFARQCLTQVIERLLVPGQASLTDAECTALAGDILRNCGVRWRQDPSGQDSAKLLPRGERQAR
ncbi:TetR/AcrR family transcriptional regulator [Bosea sp. AAP35]|uniref:TetR/AcrR family transcriptional regulator n=1 Tax=Bosea sp. AAP35 TaxID=1523417 RepID=UPI0006B9DF42|nr:TetR/AcrR family transcriptional regulator [Bosea sp. AAP35]